MGLNRDDGGTLLTEYTKSESLLKHAMAVEAAVRGYARKFGENEDDWGVTALLHAFDYERWRTLGDHPNKGAEIMRAKEYPDWMIRAILSHATEITGVPRDGLLEKTLFACDELAGFITSASLVRPSKSVLDLEASSVKKRMKDKEFARGVKREDLTRGGASRRRAAGGAHQDRDGLHARPRRCSGTARDSMGGPKRPAL